MASKTLLIPVPMDEFLHSIKALIAAEFQKHIAEKEKLTLNFEEACKYLGYSRSHLYKLTSAGIVPFSKPNGKRIFFDRIKLDEWLLSNSSTSDAEKDIKASTYITTRK